MIKRVRNFLNGFMLVAALLSFTSAVWATETVKLAQFGKEKFMLYLPLYVAMEAGYFADEGLDIELVFAGNDDQIFASVASGAVDFGMGDPVFTAIAQEKGYPAKTVAMMITKLGNTGYTNNPDILLIDDPADLAGLRIGSFPNPSTTYILMDELVRTHQDVLKDTEIVQAGMGAQLALLEAGKVDIALDLEPAVSKLEAQGYRIVFNLNEYIEPQVITGLMVRQEMIDQNPDHVQGMVRALQKGLDTIHNDRIKTLEIAQKLFPALDPNIIEKALNRMMAKDVYPSSVVVPDDYWQRTLKTRLEAGDLQALQPTGKSVDNRFALEAQKVK